MAGLALPVCSSGRAETVERWLDWFDDELVLEQYPIVSVLGAWVHVLRGRPAAKRCLAAAEVGKVEAGCPTEAGRSSPGRLLRAAMCQDGVEQMRADAEGRRSPPGRVEPLAPRQPWSCMGLQSSCSEKRPRATKVWRRQPRRPGAWERRASGPSPLAERCLLTDMQEDTTEADALVQETRDLIGEARSAAIR